MLKQFTKFLGVLVIGTGMVSCGKKEAPVSQARQVRTPQVEGYVVSPQSISDRIEVPGSLLPGEQTQIRSEVSGRIVALNIREGSVVEKGALLVKLFDG
ncbi:MAG TPA: biotin/lipoyl-binding protein, partial [Cyclobacteriaceae bacterium]|nr:biotin/lipoyl-binding protein [Cyclobacteriaceae bacterium]